MLIGHSTHKPSLKTIRHIKLTLRKALDLPEEAIITIAQLTCLEEGCTPLETAIGLLQPNQSQLQYKIHKSVEAIDVDDLKKVCVAWGYDTQRTVLESFFKEH